MQIKFSDSSYIEVIKKENKVIISISAKDSNNILKRITNTVELTLEEYDKLIS